MSMTIFLMVQVLLAVALIALILIQRGRGADTGAAFGSGASTTVFGARGSASFLTRATSILAILFFSNCFVLSYLSGRLANTAPTSVMERATERPAPASGERVEIPQDTQPIAPEDRPPPADGAAAESEIPSVEADASEAPPVDTAGPPVSPDQSELPPVPAN